MVTTLSIHSPIAVKGRGLTDSARLPPQRQCLLPADRLQNEPDSPGTGAQRAARSADSREAVYGVPTLGMSKTAPAMLQ